MWREWSGLRRLIWLYAGTVVNAARVIYTTVTGAIASFAALHEAPLRSLVVDLPYKAAGYTEINIISANANLVEEYLEHGLAQSGDHYNYRDTTGTSVLFRCKAGVTYYVKRGTGANRAVWGFFYDKPVAGSSQTVAHQANSDPATAPFDGWCIFYLKASSYVETCAKGTQVSLEAPGDVVLPDTTVYPVTIPTPPGTVYGGTLDVISGIVTATKDADGNDITPVEYNLTAQEVDTRIGANTVWSDAGDVTVEYRSN